MRCPNCDFDGYQGGNESCFQCGKSALIGPGPDDDGLQSESAALPRLENNDANPACPACGSGQSVFDGWDCAACGYALPAKDRKAHPKTLSPQEDAALRRRLGIG